VCLTLILPAVKFQVLNVEKRSALTVPSLPIPIPSVVAARVDEYDHGTATPRKKRARLLSDDPVTEAASVSTDTDRSLHSDGASDDGSVSDRSVSPTAEVDALYIDGLLQDGESALATVDIDFLADLAGGCGGFSFF